MHIARLPLMLLVTSLIVGCFGVHRTQVEMEPVLIEVGEADSYRVFSPRDLLREANADDDCGRAAASYEKLLASFPDSPEASAAAYNLGLCREVSRDFVAARQAYASVLDTADPRSDVVTDARLRDAHCLEKLEQFEDAARKYRRLAHTRRVPDDLRLGARLRWGISLIRAGHTRRGHRITERALGQAEAQHESLPAEIRAAAAEAAYLLAEQLADAYVRLPLRLPTEQLTEDLTAKMGALSRANNAYVRSMSFHDAWWAARSAVRLGELYEQLHDGLRALPEPSLSPDALEIYREELASRLLPLRQRAFQTYLQVVLLAERVGFESDATRKAVERVRALEPELKDGVLPGDR